MLDIGEEINHDVPLPERREVGCPADELITRAVFTPMLGKLRIQHRGIPSKDTYSQT